MGSSKNGSSAASKLFGERAVVALEPLRVVARRSSAACACRSAAPWRRPPCDAPIMRARLLRVCAAAGRAGHRWRRVRSPPPPGGAASTSPPMRAAPPAVVSPLMLALTTRQPGLALGDALGGQRHPALRRRQAVGGRQRIAQHQHGARAWAPAPARAAAGRDCSVASSASTSSGRTNGPLKPPPCRRISLGSCSYSSRSSIITCCPMQWR